MTAICPNLRALAVPIDRIRPDRDNPRLHGDRSLHAIRASLSKFGQQKPIVVSADGVAVAGNGVLLAARQLGWSHVAAVRSNLRAAALRGYSIADNRTGELSEWDEHRLAEQLRELAAAQVDLESLGFTSDELADVLYGSQQPEDEPAAPAVEAKRPYSRPGEIYRLGSHRLLCGDSRKAESYASLMGESNAAVCITSPPYGVGKSYEEKGIAPWLATVTPAIEHICRRARVVVWNIGDLYATASQYIEPTFAHSIEIFRRHGFRPLWIRIWLKQGMNFGVGPYHLVSAKPVQQYEYMGAFGTDEEGAAISREDFDGTDFEWIIALAGAKYRFIRRLSPRQRRQWGYAGIWQMNTVAANDQHPAMFPLELPLRAMLMHSDRGDLVLDPFCGAGTTIIAAERTGRTCLAIELSPRFCDVARRRWAELAGSPGCNWRKATPPALKER